jgi:hypothetical protein
MSPVQADYAIKAYFGWLGSTVASVSDKAVQPWSDVEKPGKPALDQYALGFAKELPEAQSKYVTNFYDNSNRINQAFADMKRYAEQGEMEKVAGPPVEVTVKPVANVLTVLVSVDADKVKAGMAGGGGGGMAVAIEEEIAEAGEEPAALWAVTVNV